MSNRPHLRALTVKFAILLSVGFASSVALAQDTVNIGISISATGPAASLGVPERNTFELLPNTLGGLPVNYIILDDATDPSVATKNARKLISSDHVDAIIGSSTTPTSLAVAQVAKEENVVQLGLAPFDTAANKWVFSVPQSYGVMYRALFEEMKKRRVETIAYIGFSDAQGEAGHREVSALTKEFNISLVAKERYGRQDQSVTAQAVRISQAKPDAVVFGASGTGAALPMHALRKLGYKGVFYQNHGVANNDFLRVAGPSGEGMICPTGFVLVADQLDDDNPSKKVALGYIKLYESRYGAETLNPFGAYAYDAYLLLDHVISKAREQAKPGTQDFRNSIRDHLEQVKDLPLTHGSSTMTSANHASLGRDAVVLIEINQGKWKLL
ncbi:MAG: ABC transporter substrate-binding protein [Burkholderiaceae bacterium]|nr:MAG: ABC transporter substrate-binding protein [Burkholderiaceae bacterium]